MLYDFLRKHQKDILALTEKKTLELAGDHPSSDQLKRGLPIFLKQVIEVIHQAGDPSDAPPKDLEAIARAADKGDEPAMAEAARQPEEAELAKSAGLHGAELLRLGYTLSHVVHAYGAMCQAVTEVATNKNFPIEASEFHALNRCLDVAIAGAVTEYQHLRDTQESSREFKQPELLAYEMRNALSTANTALQIIKDGSVGFKGATGRVLEKSMSRIEELIDRSLTEARQAMKAEPRTESVPLLQLVDQIVVASGLEAASKRQTVEVKIDPTLVVEADQQAIHTALASIIQNALSYSHEGGKIHVRGSIVGDDIEIEIRDECGGKLSNATELFKPLNERNDKSGGIGLGLTIAWRSIELNHGAIEARNIPGKCCIFKITLPKTAGKKKYKSEQPAA